MSMLNVFQIAGSALNAQSLRLNTTASNLANADSVTAEDGQPYRAKQVVFAAQPVAGPAAVAHDGARLVRADRAHGGDLALERSEGGRTTFVLTLPAIRA